MSRTLSFREQEAIRQHGAIEVVCSEADGGRVFKVTTAMLRRRDDDRDLVAYTRDLLDAKVILPGPALPNKFLNSIIFRASPHIRQMLARAMHEDEPHD